MKKQSAILYRTYAPQIKEGLKEKAKFITTTGMLPEVNLKKVSLEEKPIYQEVNKIPVNEQIELINKQRMLNNLMLKQHPELSLPPSQDELKRQYLEKLYLENFPKNAELT